MLGSSQIQCILINLFQHCPFVWLIECAYLFGHVLLSVKFKRTCGHLLTLHGMITFTYH